MHIRKGDNVKILSGKDQAKTGKVIAVDYKFGKATVEGRNIFVKHQRPKKAGEKGQKVQMPRPLQISNLMLVCPHCGKPTTTRHMVDEKGIKARVCKKCEKRIT